VGELAASGVYSAVSVSEPTASEPAGMFMVAVPPLSVAAPELYPPPVMVTLPVAAGVPVPPLTPTVTESAWGVVMLDNEGVTVTVGVVLDTVTLHDVPVALV
jgi:hypothetical protein